MKIKQLERHSTELSIASFHEQNQLGKFNFEPPYQRRSIWSDEKQSFLIDSILRNFPIPPIFLDRKIDPNTGKTTFDVIDGKQRLTAIARFINNEIPAASERALSDADNLLDGVYFRDLSANAGLAVYKAAFWKYNVAVEYIDPTDEGLIEEVFDRLNRNGEKLTGQELRNAQYHACSITKAVDDLVIHPYMKERLKVTDLTRMEDKEFCSECLFSVHKNEVIGSSRTILDALYEQHKDDDFTQSLAISRQLCDALNELDLDYSANRITGVSHLYGLWGLALILHLNDRNVAAYKEPIRAFYNMLRIQGAPEDPMREDYTRSMSSRTKERYMRVKRVNALLAVCGEKQLTIE